jgi:hypothetical protein
MFIDVRYRSMSVEGSEPENLSNTRYILCKNI